MAEKVLFLLAGYSGAGKTTLLLEALKHRVPLFGMEYDSLFRAIKLPASFPEHETPIAQILDQGTWFAETHLPELARLKTLPDVVLLHLDLNQMVTAVPALAERPAALLNRLPRTLRSLADEEENLRFLENVLSDPFFGRFDRVVVNTLYAPWDVISRQWHDRRISRKKHRPACHVLDAVASVFRRLRHAVLQAVLLMCQNRPLQRKRYLFDFKRPGAAIHQAIYRAWFRAIEQLQPDLALLSEVRDGRLTLACGGQVVYAQPFHGDDPAPAHG